MTLKRTTMHKRIPATIISGFLGSGKTTLLNHILSSETDLRAAVLVNDFGSINIDSQLITSNDGKVMNLANGCICCNLSDDLMGQIDEILNQENPPESFLIESSGVSDPGRIARILNYRMFRDRVRIDAIINMVDADQFDNHTGEFKELAEWQLKQADIVLINKADLVDSEKLRSLKQWIPEAKPVFETEFAKVPMALLLGVDAHQAKSHHDPDCSGHNCQHDHVHETDHSNLFESIAWQSDQPVNLDALKNLVKQLPTEIYRAKGVFNTGAAHFHTVMQKVGGRIDWSEEPSNTDSSSFIMIAKNGSVDFDAITEQLDRQLICQ